MFVIRKKKVASVIQREKWSLGMGVSQSLIAEFLSCREKARLGYKELWTSEQTSNALTFGTLLHNCLEDNYKQLMHGKQIGLDYLENVMRFVIGEYKKQIALDRMWTPEDEQQLIINQGYLEAIMPVYWQTYFKKDIQKKYLAVEKEFKQSVVNSTTLLRGKIDIAYQVDNEVWIMDHKTTSNLDTLNDTGLSFNLQGMFYILNWWYETHKLPSGFIQNVIKRPALRQGKAENVKHFIDRVRGDVDESYFKRIQVTITKEEFDYWYNIEFKRIMEEFEAWANGTLPTYRNPASCQTRYGDCKMLKICGLKDFTGMFQRKKVFQELI